jgi:hypothetical protein
VSCGTTTSCDTSYKDKVDSCTKAGGYPVTSKDSAGCEYYQDCKYTTTACEPVPAEKVDSCKRAGMTAQYARDSNGCEYVSGCYAETGTSGGGSQCAEVSKEKADYCYKSGGQAYYRTDSNGCEYIECAFSTTTYPTVTATACASTEDNDAVSQKCKEMGLSPTWAKDMNGCAYVTCEQSWDPCEAIRITPEIKDRMIKGCGGAENVASYVDGNGCDVLTCRAQQGCVEITADMKDGCEKKGGYLVTKEDNGCVYTAECVKRGSDTNINYADKETRKEVSATDLLELALKLENLKVKIDSLALTCRKLGAYYDGTGDKDQATKFKTIAGMFYGINTKIDDIKSKIRSRMGNLGESDMDEIQHDILYIKEVAMQDILWVLLGNGKELTEQVACGGDQDCFKRALRLCQPATLSGSEGGSMMTAKISGLDGTSCTILFEIKDDSGAYAMTCKDPDYVSGELSNDVIEKYCTGSLVDRMREQQANTTVSAPTQTQTAATRSDYYNTKAAPVPTPTSTEPVNPNLTGVY